MGKFRFVAFSLALAACGSDKATPVDAAIDSPRPIDAKVWFDAPPVNYDLDCYGMTPGTTVGDPIVVTGTAGSAATDGTISGLAGITIDFYKVGSNTSAKTVTSTTGGAYTSGDLTGAVAIDHLRGQLTGYRTSYLYPPQPIRTTLNGGIPLPLISESQFNQIGALGDQDDTMYGAMLVTVTDCNIGMPQLIADAVLHVQEDGQDVGTAFPLGQFIPEAAGTFFVFNVPDNVDIEVWATYDGKTFPKRTVRAFKQSNGATPVGTITATAIPPGPVY